MDGLLITWRELLIGLALVAVFFLLQAIYYFVRRRGGASVTFSKDVDHEVTQLRQELDFIRLRMAVLEDQLKGGLPSAMAVVPPADPEEEAFSQSPHGRAMLLARDGLDANELARQCGISISEASLIVAMTKQRASARG